MTSNRCFKFLVTGLQVVYRLGGKPVNHLPSCNNAVLWLLVYRFTGFIYILIFNIYYITMNTHTGARARNTRVKKTHYIGNNL